jgi:hypothetical protein
MLTEQEAITIPQAVVSTLPNAISVDADIREVFEIIQSKFTRLYPASQSKHLRFSLSISQLLQWLGHTSQT